MTDCTDTRLGLMTCLTSHIRGVPLLSRSFKSYYGVGYLFSPSAMRLARSIYEWPITLAHKEEASGQVCSLTAVNM